MGVQVKTQVNPEVLKDIDKIKIPDLWQTAMNLPEVDKEAVLEVWHLCHSLKRHIQKQ